jgi:hypothetical protein
MHENGNVHAFKSQEHRSWQLLGEFGTIAVHTLELFVAALWQQRLICCACIRRLHLVPADRIDE